MPVVSPEKLVSLQHAEDYIRNICILAHVDHGKTSLADVLIATNGIISPKLAGKIRYLDSRPDEQSRGITMESSAISLLFSLLKRRSADAAPEQNDYLINLIDSPGHIDFSSEVSTASRLCDGAVVLVDAVEGVCSQTITVLRLTWVERLKPILVINKMDRLITELKMNTMEAYRHLSQLLEQVNAIMGSFFQGERMEDDLRWRERVDERVTAIAAREQERTEKKLAETADGMTLQQASSETITPATATYEEKDDEDIYFAPENNNVVFSSAMDGWAFTVKQFAGLYEKKLGIKHSLLEKMLWGDFYLDPKTKRILGSKHLKGRHLKPMFVQLVLDNIWAVYEATTGGNKGKGDPVMIEKITNSLSITIPNHVLRSKDPRTLLTTLFYQWLPLSKALLVTVIDQLPSPRSAQAARIQKMIDDSPASEFVAPEVREAMQSLRKSKATPVVAFVSKMVAIQESELPENKRKGGSSLPAAEARELSRKKRAEIARAQATEALHSDNAGATRTGNDSAFGVVADGAVNGEDNQNEREHLIGFARIYAGTITVGDELYVLLPKFSPAYPHAHPEPQKVPITALYLLMGRGLEPLDSVPAGVVFGVAGLEGHILKSGTLCSQLEGSVNLAGLSLGSQPIVRVALEPENPEDLGRMVEGLRMLEQSDPCAEYEMLETGEHVIVTAGELHLERCLKDVRERFARCAIQASAPIVPYRETIISASEMNPPRNPDLPRGTVINTTISKQISIRLRVRPLPTNVTEFLQRHAAAIKRLYAEKKAEEESRHTVDTAGNTPPDIITEHDRIEETGVIETGQLLSLDSFKTKLNAAFSENEYEREAWSSAAENITAFGPRRVGPNVLIDATKDSLFGKFLHRATEDLAHEGSQGNKGHRSISARDFTDKISYAFQLATAHGPLCDEPMQGVAVSIEDISLNVSSEEADSLQEQLGRLTGEVIKTVRGAISQGFRDWSPRLMLAMYSCEIQASTEVLGRVYGVITRRRGHILSEYMKEGTPFFTIVSVLPVVESFGFAEEIRKRTSGAASPQLIFQGYEMLDEDPFWVPFTEEDLEDLGELADKENIAKRYMDAVRKRKGLRVEGKKLVINAEKQKTLKR